MRLWWRAFALALFAVSLTIPSLLRAQSCPGNNCSQSPDGSQFLPPLTPICSYWGQWGIPDAMELGQYDKYLYAYGEWGPGRFSLTDPTNPILASYYPMTTNCNGPIAVGGDGYQAGDRMAVAEAPDGSAAVFVNWKLGAGTPVFGYPVAAVLFNSSGKPSFAGGVNYDPGTGHMDGLWISGHYYGYIPTRISGVQSVGVVDAANPTVSAGVISWTTSFVRGRTLDVPSSGSNYLVAAGGSKVYVALLGSNGLPTQQNVTTITPYVAGEVDIAAVNGSLYLFVNGTGPDPTTGKTTAGISVFQVNAEDLSLTLVPELSGVIPAQVAGMTVSGKPFPAIVALAGGDLRIFGTKWLASGTCPPDGPDIAYNKGPNDPPITISIMDGFTMPNNAGVMAYRFVDIAQPNPGLTLRSDFFRATCIVGDTTSPPTAGIKVTNTSSHYASDPTNYFGDTFTVADQSSSGAPLVGANFDLNYVSPTFTKDITVTSPGPPFTAPGNLYLPCDIAAGGQTSGTGCYTSVGSPASTKTFVTADQSWNKNNPNDQPPSNTATQSIGFVRPQVAVANLSGGVVPVLTGGNLGASSTGSPQAFCWMWSPTTTPPAYNTTFAGCDATGAVPNPALPGSTQSFSLTVGYYPDKALWNELNAQVQFSDLVPNVTWTPTTPVFGSNFTLQNNSQKGSAITVTSADVWIDNDPANTAAAVTSPACSPSVPVPCSLYHQASNLPSSQSVVAPSGSAPATYYLHALFNYTGGTLSSVEFTPTNGISLVTYQPAPVIKITGSGVSVNQYSTPPTQITVNTQGSFLDQTAADSGHVTKAEWNFGDGVIQDVPGNPPDPTVTPLTHTYTSTGTPTVTLCLNNATYSGNPANPGAGCAALQVGVQTPTPFSVSAHASPSTAQPNQSVSFSVSVSGGNGGTVSTCDWSFGDGSSHSSSCSPSHSYSSSGNYSVSVAVTTSGGDNGTGTTSVSVSSGGGGGPDCNLYPWLPECSGGGGGSFSISVSGPTGGLPGQTLAFIASPSNQTGSVTYSWDFGDGGTATGSNVSHAWSAVNTYSISVSAQDGGGHTARTSLQVAISTTGCPPGQFQCQGLDTTASMQSASGSGNANSWTLTAGNSITFTADETSTGTNYDWVFSDDGTEISGTDQQTVTHYFASASPSGSPFTVTLTVTNGTASATGTFSITVVPRPYSALLVLGAGHLDDSAHGYTWKTDLALFNPTANPMNIYLDYEKRDPYNGQNGDPSKLPYSAGPAFTLYPNQGIPLSDVVNNSNVTSANAGDPGQRGDVGFLYIQYTGSAPPQAAASIYAERASDGATFGSALPIIPVANGGNGISSITLTQARLVGLKNGPSYRSILYVFNPSSQPASYDLTVYRSDGTPLANYPQTITVQPFEWQADSLSSAAWGTPDDSQTYFAKIAPTNANSNAPVFAQASVVDNRTGDSVVITDNTTTPIGISTGAQFTYYIPGAGRIDSNGHHWRTDLWLYNPGSIDQHILVTYRYTKSDGTETYVYPANGNPTVPAHGELSLADVIGQLLGLTSDNTQGTLMITFAGGNSPSDNAIAISGRVYDDQGSAGTVGTQLQAFLSPNGDELSAGSSKSLVLTGLVADASGRWRSNIGIATPSINTAETSFNITVYDAGGNAVYGPAPWTINQSSSVANGIRSFVQIPISTYVPSGYTGGLSVVISGVTGGPIIGYGTVIDGASGDSVYLPMAKTQ